MAGVLSPGGLLWQLARGSVFGGRPRRRWERGRLAAVNPSPATLGNLLRFAGLAPPEARDWALALVQGHAAEGSARLGRGVSVRWSATAAGRRYMVLWRRPKGRPAPPPMQPGGKAA
jgi:hypothetical protein